MRSAVYPGRRHRERHDERGPEPVARHVTDHDADAVAWKVEEVVEVPAYRLGLTAARRDIGASGDDERRRQQLELEIAGKLELPPHLLLAQITRRESGVFDRRTDLVRDRCHELAVPRREGVLPQPAREGADADGTGRLPGRGVQHGDGQKGLPL